MGQSWKFAFVLKMTLSVVKATLSVVKASVVKVTQGYTMSTKCVSSVYVFFLVMFQFETV